MEQLRSTKTSPRDAWSSIAKAYSRSELTKEEDKIIALAGIAEATQEKLRDEYVVGLWKRNLGTELLWSVGNMAGLRPSPCVAPTWSWLSTNGQAYLKTTAEMKDFQKSLITVNNVSVDLVDPTYPTGNIHPGATLKLRGRLKPAKWNLIRRYGPTDFRKYQVTCDGLKDTLGGFDIHEDLWTEVDVSPGLELASLDIFLLPVAIMTVASRRCGSVQGLVLTPKMLEREIYERVACFRSRSEKVSYLFLERPSENGGPLLSQEPSDQRLLDPDGLVEGFPFDGGSEWHRIPEKDIIVV